MMKRRFRVIVERTEDGYVAYPIGLQGVVVSDGDTFEEALSSLKSAIAFHIQTFGEEALGDYVSLEDTFITEAEVAVDAQIPA
jgi:predicted RNase H-like HicB family nuclease